MVYNLDFTDKAKEDIEDYKKAGNKAILNKLLILLEDITEHPYTGKGKPKALRYSLSGTWSRRITQEHRIIYEVEGDTIFIHSVKGHYE